MEGDVPPFQITNWQDPKFWEIQFDDKVGWDDNDSFHRRWFVSKERCPDRIALYKYIREHAKKKEEGDV